MNYFEKVGAHHVDCDGNDGGDVSDGGDIEDSHELPCKLYNCSSWNDLGMTWALLLQNLARLANLWTTLALCRHSSYILHFGYIPAKFLLQSGYVLATFWLYSGYILASFWLHSG